jgi:hypothetical protein
MARADSGKWVQRAGATGGGRTYRGQMPLKWYGSLVLICILGVALVVYSRYELQHPAPAIQPTVGTHWFAAFGVDLCGSQQPNLAANPNASKAPVPGLRTDGDGVIQVAPTTAKDAGDNATLARFVQTYPKLTLTSGSLGLPGKHVYNNGQKCPTGSPDAGKAGTVQIKVWPSFTPPGSNHPTIQTDPSAVRLADGQLITLAFVPSGKAIPKPPGAAVTAMLNDRVNAGEATTTVPTPATPTTTAPSATTTAPTTTAPKTTTTAPKTTTTAPKTTTTAPKTTTTKPASSPTTTGR